MLFAFVYSVLRLLSTWSTYGCGWVTPRRSRFFYAISCAWFAAR